MKSLPWIEGKLILWLGRPFSGSAAREIVKVGFTNVTRGGEKGSFNSQLSPVMMLNLDVNIMDESGSFQ